MQELITQLAGGGIPMLVAFVVLWKMGVFKPNKVDIEEFLFRAYQSGKKETSGLVSDISKKLAENNVELRGIREHLGHIDTHLLQLNSKVATNVEKINNNAVEIARLQGKR